MDKPKKRIIIVVVIVAVIIVASVAVWQISRAAEAEAARLEAEALAARQEEQAREIQRYHGAYAEALNSDIHSVTLEISQADHEAFEFAFAQSTPWGSAEASGRALRREDGTFSAGVDGGELVFALSDQIVAVTSPGGFWAVGEYHTMGSLPLGGSSGAFTCADAVMMLAIKQDIPLKNARWFNDAAYALMERGVIASSADYNEIMDKEGLLAMVNAAFGASGDHANRELMACMIRDIGDAPGQSEALLSAYIDGILTLDDQGNIYPREAPTQDFALQVINRAQDAERARPVLDMEQLFYAVEIPQDVQLRMEGRSMQENPHIGYDDLRYLRLAHYGYDSRVHMGEMVVNAAIADEVVQIFRELFNNKFPIEKMCLIDDYNAHDESSMRDNNTSAFCYRIVTGTSNLSNHARGRAIDINPLYNPFVQNGRSDPQGSAPYMDRNQEATGMIHADGICVEIFKKYGWRWGGDWNGYQDYQHFDKAG